MSKVVDYTLLHFLMRYQNFAKTVFTSSKQLFNGTLRKK